MSCILCLKSNINLDDQIQISSDEAKLLDVQRIIEMHFWLQIDTLAKTSLSHSILVCRPCWQLVLSFHQFYLSVQHAHNQLKEIQVKVSEVFINELENEPTSTSPRTHSPAAQQLNLSSENIKLEPDKTEDDTEVSEPPKKRRGRPPKQKDAKREKVIFAESTTIDADELLKNIKSEALQEDFIDVNDLLDSEGEEEKEHTNIAFAENGLSDCDYEPEEDYLFVGTKKKSKQKSKKISFCKQTLVSKQSDEFIAENYKLNCCLCNSPLTDFSELKAHFRVQHQARGYALCCGKKFLKRGLLCDHIHLHQDPQYFKCARCEKILANRRCLELHLKGHEETRERIYHCEVCPKSFYRQSIYLRHTMLHVPEEQKKFKCPQCDKPFATKYLMTQHLKLVHLNMYAKMCDVCGKSIRGRDALRRHQEEHEGVQQAPIQCDLCGFTLTSKYGLARHKRVMHTEGNLQSQVCPICSKVSPTLSAHQRHMKYMHSMQRKHACPMCDKAFKRPTDLKEHMTTHTGEVLYTCPHCPKTFNSNANMHSHRKKMHRKEWEEKRQQKYNFGHKLRLERQEQTLSVSQNCSATTAAAVTSNTNTELS